MPQPCHVRKPPRVRTQRPLNPISSQTIDLSHRYPEASPRNRAGVLIGRRQANPTQVPVCRCLDRPGELAALAPKRERNTPLGEQHDVRKRIAKAIVIRAKSGTPQSVHWLKRASARWLVSPSKL